MDDDVVDYHSHSPPVDNFKPRRYSSMRIPTSRTSSSFLFSDSIPTESARFTGYQRLSQSMRLTRDPNPNPDPKNKNKKNKAWVLISKVFSFRRQSNGSDEVGVKGNDSRVVVEKPVKSRRSSWLPDPNRRWPVQGCRTSSLIPTLLFPQWSTPKPNPPTPLSSEQPPLCRRRRRRRANHCLRISSSTSTFFFIRFRLREARLEENKRSERQEMGRKIKWERKETEEKKRLQLKEMEEKDKVEQQEMIWTRRG